ncbi:glycosyltransferase family 1 protein [Paenibacillus nasutitermitis]|uniref:Glycosyltransferase EpsF n=1 Tax=Paenibacillus nasutitermitis TaxID=1652958 RepID=A0A916Z309_9BACL|nr:glycosyltransferase family 1 protein [Paenibacillus nasutitermitis]GGD73362.1 putative glycosyltransferase EpsF [Paenibacillus nasutitermitis]
MRPVRILQVVTVMNRGGLETMIMNYYRQMDRAKIQFDFMVHRAGQGHYDDEILALGGKIHRMPQIRPGAYRSYFKQLDIFFAEHPEYGLVHAHINENSSFVLRAARKAGVPCRIAHSHLSDLGFDKKLPFRLYARYAMKDHPNSYFACSRKAGEWLFGRRIHGQSPLIVMHNAVPVQEFSFQPAVRHQIRDELNAEGRLVIGHIGRFNMQKNHEFLIDVFQAVHHRNPDALLVLAGEGQLKSAMQRKAEKLGLSQHIRFLGVRTDISRLLQGMDLFLFPSRFEGLPVVLIEAQAAGLKCVVSDAITREADVTGRLQYASLQESPEAWARYILESTYEHEDTAEALRKQGYDTGVMAKWLGEYYINRLAAADAR